MIYAVVAQAGAERLNALVAAHYPDHFAFRPSCWFVVEPLAAEDVSAKLGISDGRQPGVQAVVLPVTGYHGYASNDLWNWLRAHWNGGR